jgi:hypothetical protein
MFNYILLGIANSNYMYIYVSIQTFGWIPGMQTAAHAAPIYTMSITPFCARFKLGKQQVTKWAKEK